MSELVLYENRDQAAILTLNRPKQRNAINAAMADALRDALNRFEADETARVGILAGAGDVFCAGMDLKAFIDGEGDAVLFGENRFAGFVDATRTKPMIAAVEGPALAGGFELALACDLMVASENALFGLPEVGVGIFACAGGPFRLARRIPPAKAMELALTGHRLSGEDARDIGLVNRLTPPGGALDAAIDVARDIARNAPLGIAATLALIRAALVREEPDLWELSDRLWQDVAASEDATEGPRAFAEKRRPNWQGR